MGVLRNVLEEIARGQQPASAPQYQGMLNHDTSPISKVRSMSNFNMTPDVSRQDQVENAYGASRMSPEDIEAQLQEKDPQAYQQIQASKQDYTKSLESIQDPQQQKMSKEFNAHFYNDLETARSQLLAKGKSPAEVNEMVNQIFAQRPEDVRKHDPLAGDQYNPSRAYAAIRQYAPAIDDSMTAPVPGDGEENSEVTDAADDDAVYPVVRDSSGNESLSINLLPPYESNRVPKLFGEILDLDPEDGRNPFQDNRVVRWRGEIR